MSGEGYEYYMRMKIDLIKVRNVSSCDGISRVWK